MTTISPTYDTDELWKLSELPTQPALSRAAALLDHLVRDPAFVGSWVLPVLEQDAEAKPDWYVARRFDAEDGSFSLRLFVWPPGTGTKVHDHAAWGAYACALGSVLEERYERTDDRSRPGHARLQRIWRLAWTSEDGASTVMPGDGGIHRVSNPGGDLAVSVHLYGPRTGEADGKDYDPSRDHVCDRAA